FQPEAERGAGISRRSISCEPDPRASPCNCSQLQGCFSLPTPFVSVTAKEMQRRRTFLKTLATTTGGGSLLLSSSTLAATSDHLLVETGSIQRKYWISVLQKIATPVLESLSRRELRRTMP